jgi:hypothetical protein
MILIGANARNTGKTNLACELIRKFSRDHSIIGLKVSRFKPGEERLHGDHPDEFPDKRIVIEETKTSGGKDTNRMLKAGARKVFYIVSREEEFEYVFPQFVKLVGEGDLIVCESRSLRRLVNPGVFILMLRHTEAHLHKEAVDFMEWADFICYEGNKEEAIESIISRIDIHSFQWKYRK